MGKNVVLWKNLWENLRESLWESCEKVSTCFANVEEFFTELFKSVSCTHYLHNIYTLIYTWFFYKNNLLVARFYTISTGPITTTINIFKERRFL